MGANIPPPPEKPKEPEPTEEEVKTPEKDEPMTEPEPKQVTANLNVLIEWKKLGGTPYLPE